MPYHLKIRIKASVILSLSKDQPPVKVGVTGGGWIREAARSTAGMPRKLILRQAQDDSRFLRENLMDTAY